MECQTPTFRKRRPGPLCVEVTGGPGFVRNERATGRWIGRWLSGIPNGCLEYPTRGWIRRWLSGISSFERPERPGGAKKFLQGTLARSQLVSDSCTAPPRAGSFPAGIGGSWFHMNVGLPRDGLGSGQDANRARPGGAQIPEFGLGLVVSAGCQTGSHNITSTTPLGRKLRSVPKSEAHCSRSFSSAATRTWMNGQRTSSSVAEGWSRG